MSTESSSSRRGYGQYCAVATALDVVGERWTLLIARDLLSGPKRYTDLRSGLPGIATDLLTARLRTLEAAGLVRRRALPPPTPATVYELTERGQMLGPVVGALAHVGFSFLGEPGDDAELPAERLVLTLRPAFHPDAAGDSDATYQLNLGGESFVLTVRNHVLETTRATTDDAELTVHTDPLTLAKLLRRDIEPDQAEADGVLEVEGGRRALHRFIEIFRWDPAPVVQLSPARTTPVS